MGSIHKDQGIGVVACVVLTIAMAVLCSAEDLRAAEPVIEYRDVGNAQDFDKKQNIYFDRGDSFGGSGGPVYWNMSWGGTGGALYENGEHFWWACSPPADAKNLISSRAIKPHHFGRFRVKADKLPREGDLFLTLRVKDDVLAPAPVFVWSGGQKWTRLGAIAGANDHRWITRQFRVPAADRQLDKEMLVFKIGVDRYNPSIQGELVLIGSRWPTPRTVPAFRPTRQGSGRWRRRAGSVGWDRLWS